MLKRKARCESKKRKFGLRMAVGTGFSPLISLKVYIEEKD